MDKIWTAVGIVVMALFFYSHASHASDFSGSVGVGQSIYTNDSDADWNFRGTLAHADVPVYLVGTYDSPRVKMLGQPLAETDIVSLGIGVERELVAGLKVFTEVGYSWLNLDVNREPYNVQQEIIYTQLVRNHNVKGRPVPVDFSEGYQTSYEADDAVFWRVGLGYQLYDSVSLTASYRVLYVDQAYTLKSNDWAEGQGYWREDETYNLSAFEVGINYTF